MPAWIAGILVLLTHVPLGQRVLQRGIIFIDLAIAQVAGLGLVAVQVLGFEAHGFMAQLVAVCSALLGAAVLYLCERRWPSLQEAIIGLVFILAASAAVLLLAQHPQASHKIDQLLNGQILWVNFEQLWPAGILYALVLMLWFAPWWRSQNFKFYILFALAVSASVQLVGVFLVFASLIIPAITIRHIKRNAIWFGYMIGALGYLFGLLGSAAFDVPAGPLIVWVLLFSGLIFTGLSILIAKK